MICNFKYNLFDDVCPRLYVETDCEITRTFLDNSTGICVSSSIFVRAVLIAHLSKF